MGSFDNMFLRIGNGILLRWLLLQFFIISLVLCQDYLNQPRDEWPKQDQQQPQPKRKQRPIDPYKLYGPHGYRTFSHARCQEVPTVDVNLEEISGDWVLNEYITSVDGKPFPPHAPYLCPESLMKFSAAKNGRFNVSQVSFEWPLVHKDVVEWEVNPRKSGHHLQVRSRPLPDCGGKEGVHGTTQEGPHFQGGDCLKSPSTRNVSAASSVTITTVVQSYLIKKQTKEKKKKKKKKS